MEGNWLARFEERVVQESPWRSYPRRRRITYAVLLTLFSWGWGAGVLLLLGASGLGFWIPFLAYAILFGAMFAVLGSGDASRMLGVARGLRVTWVTAFLIAGVLAVVSIVVSVLSER